MKKKWTAEERAAFAAKMAKYRKKKRSRNPSRIKAKFDRCVKKVRRKSKVKNSYAVCMKSLRKNKMNPVKSHGVVLFIQKGTGPKMHFNGSKFTNNGQPVKFPSVKAAEETAKQLHKRFPILRGYAFKVYFPGQHPK